MEKTAPKEKEPVGSPDHTVQITAQVLAKIGKPPRLERVEVCQHHNGNYRVNVWELSEPKKDLAITSGARIASSYYIKVTDAGDIISSNPPLVLLYRSKIG